MKRFILRSVAFAAIVIVFFGSICAFELRYELDAYREELKAPAAASILVCNDSQFDMSVDPAADPAFFNFSAHGRTMDQAYLSLLDVFAANPDQFRIVAIDISPSAAVDPFDQAIPDMGYASQYYLLHWLHPKENRRDMSGQLAVFRDNMVGRRWRLFWRSLRGKAEFTSSICGRYTPVPDVLSIQSPKDFAGQCEARANTVNMVPAVTVNAPIYRHVAEIVEFVRARGAEPVIVTTPWHPALLAACKREKLESFSSATAEFARSVGCRYVDMLREEFDERCWYDAQHLNSRGAKEFTPRLKAALAGDRR